MKKTVLCGLIGLLAIQPVSAIDLIGAYEKALTYDSGLAAAKATYEVQSENIDLTQSSLLPQIDAFSEARYVNNNGPFQSMPFSQYSFGIELSQPLFRADAWFNYQASKSLTKAENARYNLAQQQLMLDLATAYFDVLRAYDNLSTARATVTAIERQYRQAQERFDVGLIAITAVYEARASFDASTSNRIAAENDLDIAWEQLIRLTGAFNEGIDNLRQQFPLARPAPMEPADWETIALNQNWSVQAALQELNAAEETLSSAKSGHYPTVDLTSRLSQSRTNTIGNQPSEGFQLSPDATTTDRQIGIRLNIPLYSGGGTQAGVRQERARVRLIEQRLQSARRDVRLNTRSLFLTVNSNIDSASALKQTIVSRRAALKATRAGYEVGTRNIVEVLNAESNFYIALRDYANARYDYIINTLNLKLAAGTLNPQDLIGLNTWLSASAPGIEALANEQEPITNPLAD